MTTKRDYKMWLKCEFQMWLQQLWVQNVTTKLYYKFGYKMWLQNFTINLATKFDYKLWLQNLTIQLGYKIYRKLWLQNVDKLRAAAEMEAKNIIVNLKAIIKFK